MFESNRFTLGFVTGCVVGIFVMTVMHIYGGVQWQDGYRQGINVGYDRGKADRRE